MLLKSLLPVTVIAALLQACASAPEQHSGVASPLKATPLSPDQVKVQDETGTVTVQKVEFQIGESSATVERMGRQSGCSSERGAGLITEKGPVEVYRMQCVDGSVFMARCELRQCRPMP